MVIDESPLQTVASRRLGQYNSYTNKIAVSMCSGHALDPWWQESEGETQGDVEEISRAGDEGSRVELGPGDEACNGQATLAFFGVGLMCDPARRGLSK